jgi:uncharacterized membrane protein
VKREVVPVPRWVVITTFALSLVGLGLSIYLTIAHYEGKQILACSTTGTLNCGVVTTSPQSHRHGHLELAVGLAAHVVLGPRCPIRVGNWLDYLCPVAGLRRIHLDQSHL